MQFCKAVFIATLFVPGCLVEDTRSSQTGAHTQRVYDSNRILSNRILSNRLAAFSLSGSAIASAQFADSTMTFNTTSGDGIETTQEGREVLDYIVRCAFAPGTVLQAEHDGVQYDYHGILGLAPEWVDRSLTEAEKSSLSACLFAHVNFFGEGITISLRFPGVVGADAAEAAQYRVREGGFYGKYFVDSGPVQWYSCQGDSYDTAIVNSDSRNMRVCTDEASGCAIEVTGRCHDVCDSYTPGEGWSDCRGGGVTYHEVANVYLNAHDPDGRNATCGANQTCIGANALDSGDNHVAILDGSGTSAVETRCGQDAVCIVDGVGSADFSFTAASNAIADVTCDGASACYATVEAGADVRLDCENSSVCDVQAATQAQLRVDCRGANQCTVRATGAEDTTINCTDAGTCTAVHCTEGAPCQLTCDTDNAQNPTACSIAECTDSLGIPAAVTDCGGGVFACNRSC